MRSHLQRVWITTETMERYTSCLKQAVDQWKDTYTLVIGTLVHGLFVVAYATTTHTLHTQDTSLLSIASGVQIRLHVCSNLFH